MVNRIEQTKLLGICSCLLILLINVCLLIRLRRTYIKDLYTFCLAWRKRFSQKLQLTPFYFSSEYLNMFSKNNFWNSFIDYLEIFFRKLSDVFLCISIQLQFILTVRILQGMSMESRKIPYKFRYNFYNDNFEVLLINVFYRGLWIIQIVLATQMSQYLFEIPSRLSPKKSSVAHV